MKKNIDEFSFYYFTKIILLLLLSIRNHKMKTILRKKLWWCNNVEIEIRRPRRPL